MHTKIGKIDCRLAYIEMIDCCANNDLKDWLCRQEVPRAVPDHHQGARHRADPHTAVHCQAPLPSNEAG